MHPTRPCRCSVGRHASAADIDAALITGGAENSLSKLEARYPPLKRASIGRHRLQCLGLGETPRDAAPETGETPARETAPAETSSTVSASPLSRKRRIGEPPPGCPTKEARVNHIITLMARLEWVTGETGPELAEQWGCSPGTVEHDACEASRAVQRQVDPGAVQKTVMAALHEGIGLALDFARSKTVGDRVIPGDPKGLAALAHIARTMAVFAPAPAPQRTGATTERPQLNVIYPEGMSPAPTTPAPSDGHPLQPAAGEGPPSSHPRP